MEEKEEKIPTSREKVFFFFFIFFFVFLFLISPPLSGALFSLAVSQILIVNTWMHDIGRFQGANYPLLRTVFEQNLRLFSHTREGDDKKTLLLFVIRDHTSFTPLEALAKAIREDIAKIWGQIAKPEQFEESVAGLISHIPFKKSSFFFFFPLVTFSFL